MPKGIHLRYLGDDVRAVPGVGVFQKGTIAFVPQETALELLEDPRWQHVTDGPTAQAFIVRIGPDRPDPAPVRTAEPEEPAEFERELEEEERRYAAEGDAKKE